MDTLFLIQLIISLAIGTYLWLFDRKMLSLNLDKINSFIGFMVLVCVLRVCLIDFCSEFFQSELPTDSGIPLWYLPFVFWEDLFFGGLVYLSHKFIKNRFISLLSIILISLWFASGHLYQGYYIAALTGIYPYFISYRFAKKNGFGTVMVCHILYDFITVLLVKFLPWVL